MVTLLSVLEPGFTWYTEDDDGSNTTILHGIRKRETHPPISQNMRFTLAAAQTCCELGYGMVYTMYRDHPLPGKNVNADDFEAFTAETVVPGLVYVLKSWTAEEQQDWRAKPPRDQLELCWAPHGWIPAQVPVLPFTVVLHPTQGEILTGPQFHGDTTSHVLVFVTGREIYVGLTEDFRQHCYKSSTVDLEGRLLSCEYNAIDGTWNAFQVYQEMGMSALISKLESINRQRIDLLEQYGSLEARVQDAVQRSTAPRRRGEALRSTESKGRRKPVVEARETDQAWRAKFMGSGFEKIITNLQSGNEDVGDALDNDHANKFDDVDDEEGLDDTEEQDNMADIDDWEV